MNDKFARGTESLINNALARTQAKKIIKDARFLDDEKLPEAERIEVLKEVFHRNIRRTQLERLAGALSPILQGESPSNLLIYGPSGAGKSVTCLHFLSALLGMSRTQKIPFQYFYLDLTTPRTCFGALNELAIALDGSARRYRKGIALEHMQEKIITSLNARTGYACILIDEADNITIDQDLFLTFLTKTLPKKVRPKLFYIFLTNRLEWEKALDPRILTVLKKQDMLFEPYNAEDLLKIVNLRVEKALNVNKVNEIAIRKIAAYASRETGDARKAVELLARSVKIAEETNGILTEAEVDLAEQSLETNKTEELIRSLAYQQKTALRACYLGMRGKHSRLSTGDAYRVYTELCECEGTRGLSQRSFSDMVSFLDIYGLINARVVSKGRYGKTRELSPSLDPKILDTLQK